MSQLSSSQEMQLEYVPCHAPGLPPIAIRRRAMEGIHQEVSEAFAAAPHRCAETGGILIGRREQDRIVVEDFEPVPSEHQFGPSYRLSDNDRALLQETLEWFRGGAQAGLSVLGFYRSHTLPDFALGAEDDELMRTQFGADEDLVLLVKPGLIGTSDAEFFMRRNGRAAPPPAPGRPAISWPAPRPRQSMRDTAPEPSTTDRRRQRWPWYTAAALLGLIGGALGYVWWHRAPAARQVAVSAPAPLPVAAPPVAGPPTEVKPAAEVEGTPAPPEPHTAELHQLLDRWATALKHDDADAAAQCYAPVVSTYFTRHNVAREAVRQSIRQGRARYGRLDVYRISGLTITPVSDSRAVATFRKHWQTSGRRRTVGEEAERMTLVRTAGAWQISSEQTE
jgi:hypothetical protein